MFFCGDYRGEIDKKTDLLDFEFSRWLENTRAHRRNTSIVQDYLKSGAAGMSQVAQGLATWRAKPVQRR